MFETKEDTKEDAKKLTIEEMLEFILRYSSAAAEGVRDGTSTRERKRVVLTIEQDTMGIVTVTERVTGIENGNNARTVDSAVRCLYGALLKRVEEEANRAGMLFDKLKGR